MAGAGGVGVLTDAVVAVVDGEATGCELVEGVDCSG